MLIEVYVNDNGEVLCDLDIAKRITATVEELLENKEEFYYCIEENYETEIIYNLTAEEKATIEEDYREVLAQNVQQEIEDEFTCVKVNINTDNEIIE